MRGDKNMLSFIGRIVFKIGSFLQRIKNRYTISCFKQYGENVHIDGACSLSARNISCGNNVFIGPGACFVSLEAKIYIGNNVMFGPNVMIVTGNHRIDVIGKTMIEVVEKEPENDLDVVIEDDVWIGMGVIILKGVTIGKGSVIGAGTILSRSIPPYSVVKAKMDYVITPRFSEENLRKHEEILRQREL